MRPMPGTRSGTTCCGGVERGTVQDRAGVVAALQEAGFDVPCQGKNYVTAHDPDSGKRWRLKGALYGA